MASSEMEIEIPRRSIYQHEVHVTNGGKILSWSFFTRRHNVGFGLYRRTTEPVEPPVNGANQIAPVTQPASGTPLVPSALSSSITVETALSDSTKTSPKPFRPRHPSTSLAVPQSDGDSRNAAGGGGDDQNNKDSISRAASALSVFGPGSDLVQLLPLERFDSHKFVVKGSFSVKEPGIYVLVFDNTFSINTSKRLTFSFSITDKGSDEPEKRKPELAGWLLKRKKLRYQGWAKRWFQLDQGTLTYYKHPNSYVRGTIHIATASVSVHLKYGMLTIDSGSLLLHMRGIAGDDIHRWLDAFKNVKANYAVPGKLLPGVKEESYDSLQLGSLREEGQDSDDDSEDEPIEKRTPGGKPTPQPLKLPSGPSGSPRVERVSTPKLNAGDDILAMAKKDAASLADQVAELRVSILGASSSSTGTKDVLSTSTTNGNATGAALQPDTTELTRKDGKGIGIKKRPSSIRSISGSSRDVKMALNSNLTTSIEKLSKSMLDRMTEMHSMLRTEREHRHRAESQLRVTREELERLRLRMSSLSASTGQLVGSARPLHRRVESTTSSVGTPTDEVFFDAEETQGVAVVQQSGLSDSSDDDEDDHQIRVETSKLVTQGERKRRGTKDSIEDRSSIDDDSDDTMDEEEDPREMLVSPQVEQYGGLFKGSSVSAVQTASISALAQAHMPHDGSKANAMVMAAMQAVMEVQGIVGKTLPPGIPLFLRRVCLPCTSVGNEVSLWSLLKQNVGKDLSRIPMPVALNEPLSMVQRLAEELEYSELLDKAADTHDEGERLLLLVAFSISGYANTFTRIRKPFTSLLGETYECIREDKGFRFIAEKVVHNPNIVACHAESDKWIFWQDFGSKSKFWGQSMEFLPSGNAFVTLKTTGETFHWCKVTTCMRGVMSGEKYLEHYGDMKLTNATTGAHARVQFREVGLFGRERNVVQGTVFGKNGEKLIPFSGRWSESLQRQVDASGTTLSVVWKAHQVPSSAKDYYGFTRFASQLNEITPIEAGWLCGTDSRLRSDIRLLEEGNLDGAEAEKQRLEEAQRNARRIREENHEEFAPRWFELVVDPATKLSVWKYKGGYWEERRQQSKGWGTVLYQASD